METSKQAQVPMNSDDTVSKREKPIMIEKASLNKKERPPWVASGDMERIAALVLAMGLNVLPSAMRARVIHHLSQVVGAVWHKTNRGTVRRVRHQLQVLFKHQASTATLESLVRAQLVLTSWNALIANLLPSLHDEHLVNLLQIEGLHHIDEIRQRNRAVLLLGFHYGVYGYAVTAALSAQGYPTRLVGYAGTHAYPPGTSYLYRKLYFPRLQRVNQWIKTIVVEPGKRSQPELEILAQKEHIVYLLADQYFVVPPGQVPASHLIPLNLLNRTVHLDVTGVRAAKQLGAQPLTAIPVQNGYRQRVLIEPLAWTNDGTTTVDVAQDLQLYLNHLEQRLLECPALWRDLRRSDLLPRMGIFEREE